MWLHQNMGKDLYLLITKDNCLACEKARDMLDTEDISYIEMDQNEVISEFIDIIRGKGVLTYPFCFKLVGDGDALNKQVLHTQLIK